MKVERETFATDGQWNKFKRLKAFFERLIELDESRHCIFVDGEHESAKPFIEGYNMGFKEERCKILWVGSTFEFNKQTGECDIPWVDISLKEVRSRITVFKKTAIKI